MRYQIRTQTPDSFGRVESLLRQERANVILRMPRRMLFSVDGLSDHLQDRVKDLGATVEAEYQFHAG
jgi:hypothetical protein